MEKQKKDKDNPIKQVKEQMNGRCNKFQEIINNLVVKSSTAESVQKSQRPYSRLYTRSSNNLCYNCAKPNHRFTECTNATESEKNKIRADLLGRTFDFKKL